MPTIEPGRAMANVVVMACAVPAHSSEASAPDVVGAFLVRAEYDMTRGWVAGQSVVVASKALFRTGGGVSTGTAFCGPSGDVRYARGNARNAR